MCASDEHQAAALADLVEKYNWDRVGMVAAKGIYGEELMADLTQQLSVATIGVTTSQMYERGSKRMTKQISMVSHQRFPLLLHFIIDNNYWNCLLYTSPSPRDKRQSRMPSSA